MTPVYRTIKSEVYTPASERADGPGSGVNGDVTYVRFEECDHVMLGNPTMSFSVGAKTVCWQCAEERQAAAS